MEIPQLASEPSDPSWQQPRWRERHVIQLQHTHHDGDDDSDESKSVARSESEESDEPTNVLDDAASELNTLCARNVPLADVQAFLAQWEDPSSLDHALQPNALAWFNDTNSLRSACTSDNRDVARVLLEKGLQPNPTVVSSAIAKLRETKNKDTVQLLINSGWDINEPLNDNTPPLMSLLLDDLELVRWCLSLGASPNVSSLSGNTVMQRAASYGSLDSLKLLVEHGGLVQHGALVARASNSHNTDVPGRLDVVRFLLDHHAPIDAFFLEDDGRNAQSYEATLYGRLSGLHFAVWGGKKDMLKLLISKGADKNLPACSVLRTEGQTMSPIEIARRCEYEDIVEILESQNVGVDT
ncbi:ankyrin repeat-containing domain protein [Xylariales sp. AK1849]|nr:ankyrin repeat-containing domain protein [Xylariales sp. AK1849]